MNRLPSFVEQRALEDSIRLAGPPNPYAGQVDVADHQLEGGLRVRVYRTAGSSDVLPGVLDIHGGGMVRGSVAGEEPNACRMAIGTPAVVVSVDYRLAPEHPYPAAIEDCWTALQWLHAEAGPLGVDPTRLALYGASAGGSLAAGTALLAP